MSDSIEAKHAAMVTIMAKPGAALLASVTAEDLALWHAATGLAGEVGELTDAVKKSVVYRKPFDLENAIEELGDIEFYLAEFRRLIGVSRGAVLQYNMNKLERRYPQGYTDQAAQARADKV